MTRAMLVTVLYRLDNMPDTVDSSFFSDVVAGEWYTAAVTWANTNGIVKGYNAYTFGTEDYITREQLAAILYRYAQSKYYDVSDSADLFEYQDAEDISDWALIAMKWAVAEELITGVSDTTLDPAGYASRAQVATLIMRFNDSFEE